MICCETAASSGDITVYGHSATHDKYSVRQLVGVCKQDDYLYHNLTAKEHLELFGGLRGVPNDQIAEIIQEWLESVDLAMVQNQYSSSYSGGMKRRLSVACSTIGDRPLIVLDEPTTGKKTWRWVVPLLT
jgi:ABC-type multidrug transport system ATPase subunit